MPIKRTTDVLCQKGIVVSSYIAPFLSLLQIAEKCEKTNGQRFAVDSPNLSQMKHTPSLIEIEMTRIAGNPYHGVRRKPKQRVFSKYVTFVLSTLVVVLVTYNFITIDDHTKSFLNSEDGSRYISKVTNDDKVHPLNDKVKPDRNEKEIKQGIEGDANTIKKTEWFEEEEEEETDEDEGNNDDKNYEEHHENIDDTTESDDEERDYRDSIDQKNSTSNVMKDQSMQIENHSKTEVEKDKKVYDDKKNVSSGDIETNKTSSIVEASTISQAIDTEVKKELDSVLAPASTNTTESDIGSRDEHNSFSFKRDYYDVCIAGAGLSGAVIAEQYASQLNQSVLVMEKRDHIAGNCYDYIDDETNIRVSKYGAHLFHTKYDRVWDYVQQFSEWAKYEHEVRHVDSCVITSLSLSRVSLMKITACELFLTITRN